MSRLLPFVPLVFALATGCGSKVEVPEPARLPALGPGVHQETTTLPNGTTLRYTVSVPRGYDPTRPVPLVVGLHDGGEATPFRGASVIENLLEPGCKDFEAVLVAPDSVTGDWVAPADEAAVVWLTRSLITTYAIDKGKVLLVGFGMGGAGSWYVGNRHQELYPVVMPIAAPVVRGAEEWKSAVFAIHSTQDKEVPYQVVEGEINDLKGRGVKAHLYRVVNLTHHQVKQYAMPIRQATGWVRDAWR